MIMTSDAKLSGPMCKFRETQLDCILDEARKSLKTKFPSWDPIYAAIDQYVIANNQVVTIELTDTLKTYKIYGTYIFGHANAIANILADVTLYVRLNTTIRNQEFAINIDNFNLIQLFNVDANLAKILGASKPDPISLLRKVPPEIELIDIYHRLYQPNFHKTWSVLLLHEGELWIDFQKALPKIVKTPIADGGNESPKQITPDVVANWIRTVDDCIIVGNFALACMQTTCPSTGAIQLIAPNPKLIIDILKRRIGVPVIVKKYELNLPTDYRLKKYVISVATGSTITYVANIYNSGGYELVPYVQINNFRIGTLTVLLRFIFIDLWFFRLLRYFELMTGPEYQKNITNLFANAEHIHSLWSFDTIIAPPTYIGAFIDETNSKKTQAAASGIYPYWPAQYKNEHGAYRGV
jgi:hypothetical protein